VDATPARDLTDAGGAVQGNLAAPLRRWRAVLRGGGRSRPALRALLVVALVVPAYHFSLLSLLRGMALETPLSYLGLIPVISLVLIVLRACTAAAEPDIHDRYLDYIVGLPLLATALAVVELAPPRLSSFFWLWRLDLLSLPFFVAGAIALVFGTRALWRVRIPVGLLLLAWPLPYTLFLVRELEALTSVTVGAVGAALRFLPVAHAYPSDDGSLFLVMHHGTSFLVSVSSPCSGSNSMIGFLLVGGAAATQMRGSRLRKLAWLASGALLMWLFDVVRILLIFAAGSAYGEKFAVDTLHPVVGLVGVCLAVLITLRLMPLFGLRLVLPTRRRAHTAQPAAPRRQPAVRRTRVAFALLLGATVAATLANTGMQRYQLLAEDLGPSRIAPAAVARASLAGWNVSWTSKYPWVTQYFGSSATWDRYVYAPTPTAHPSADSHPVFLDLLSTSDLFTFSTYGLDACYRFHNYEVLSRGDVDLGGGLIGHEVTYHMRTSGATWTAVYWEWPVRTAVGDRYERVILSISTTRAGDTEMAATRTALRSFADRLVSASAALAERGSGGSGA
jgi:exosortase/archaeosortase family protein